MTTNYGSIFECGVSNLFFLLSFVIYVSMRPTLSFAFVHFNRNCLKNLLYIFKSLWFSFILFISLNLNSIEYTYQTQLYGSDSEFISFGHLIWSLCEATILTLARIRYVIQSPPGCCLLSCLYSNNVRPMSRSDLQSPRVCGRIPLPPQLCFHQMKSSYLFFRIHIIRIERLYDFHVPMFEKGWFMV